MGAKQRLGQVPECLGVGRDERLRWDAPLAGTEHILEGVLVGARLEPHAVPEEPGIARQGIRLDEFQSETDMRRGVDVGNRGRDIGGLHWRVPFLLPGIGAKRKPKGGMALGLGRSLGWSLGYAPIGPEPATDQAQRIIIA